MSENRLIILVLSLAMATLLAPTAMLAAGSASFNNLQAQPNTLPTTGGQVNVTVGVTDPQGVVVADIQVRYPDGGSATFSLNQQNATLWQGTVTLKKNFSTFPELVQLVVEARNSVSKYSRSDPYQVTVGPQPQNAPQLFALSVPPMSTEYQTDTVNAQALNVDPASVQFGMYINVPDWGWIGKPYCGNYIDLVNLNSDGTVSALYDTGGYDFMATEIVGYLFPTGASVPCNVTPDDVDYLAVAKFDVFRTRLAGGRTVNFAGYIWDIRDTGEMDLSPGPNFFAPDNVYLDTQGLHLKLSSCTVNFYGAYNTYCASEVSAEKSMGYGTYTFTVNGSLSKLSPDIILGLFTYGPNAGFGHREIDMDFGTSDGSHDAQFAVQPAKPDSAYGFNVPANLTTATLSFTWTPGQISFKGWAGSSLTPPSANLLAQWVLDRTSSSVDVPPYGDQVVHMNLWPTDPYSSSITPTEIVVSNFQFTPAQPSLAPFGLTNAASYEAGGVAPGTIMAVFGSGLGPVELALGLPDSTGFQTTSVSGTKILFNGIPAPLLYTSGGQLACIVPFGLYGSDTVTIQAVYNNTQSEAITLPVAKEFPGIFTDNSSGGGNGAILNQDSSLNSPANPAGRGSIVAVYVTGIGQTNPGSLDGQFTGSAPPFAAPLATVTATIGGSAAVVTFAGSAPTFVAGAAQINIKVPATAPVGASIPLVLNVGGSNSQIVAIAIR